MIDNVSFEQYKKYREYIENEILKLTGIPKKYLNENKDERWTEYDCRGDANRD
jgi:hypothetical protein